MSDRLNSGLVRPRVLPMAPAPTVLLGELALDTTTSTSTTQVPDWPMVPREGDGAAPAVAATAPSFTLPVPEQFAEAFGAGATTMPAGKVSVKLVNGMLWLLLGLLSVMVNRVGSPT